MPTVYRIDGLRVVIFPDDHSPAHVHVVGGGREAVFDLNCPDGPPVLRRNREFRGLRAHRIEAALTERLNALCAKWWEIHGDK